MPNHCDNLIRFGHRDPKVVDHLIAMLAGKHSDKDGNYPLVDFNRLIEMPETIRNAQSSSVAEWGQAACDRDETSLRGWWNRFNDDAHVSLDEIIRHLYETYPEAEEQGRLRRLNLDLYGHPDWYSWSNAHWGTKWNAYSVDPEWERFEQTDYVSDERDPEGDYIETYFAQIEFQSAWSPPRLVLAQIYAKTYQFGASLDTWYRIEGNGESRYDPRKNLWVRNWIDGYRSGTEWEY